MAEWGALAIGLQLFIFIAITISLIVQATTKHRASRLKKTKQVEATLLLDNMGVLPIKLFLPSRQFIANMIASLDRHTQEARLFWEHEKVEDPHQRFIQLRNLSLELVWDSLWGLS